MLNVPVVPDKDGNARGFDVVIGNPPYVRQEKFTHLKSRLQKIYPSTYDGKADLYVYFYDRALQSLRPGGVLCFITANKFFMRGYGQKLRSLLTSTTSFSHLLDFGDASVFEAVAYPTIVITQKRVPEKAHRLQAFLWEPGPAIETFSAVFNAQAVNLPQKALANDGWRLDDTTDDPLLARLRKAGKPLDEFISGEAYRGLVPGSPKFFIDEATKKALITADPKSADVIKPVLMGRDITPYNVAEHSRYLLFIPWHFPLQDDSSVSGASLAAEKLFAKNYPAVYNYLSSFKLELEARNQQETGVRYEWYALQRWASGYYKQFEQPKIMYQKFQVKPCFIYDEAGLFCNDSIWMLPNASKYLLGILNSRMGWYLISQFCTRIQNGYQLIYQYLRHIPIIVPTRVQEQQIEKLVNQILKAKAANATADTTALERKIDVQVYHLYGLKYAEVLVVEPGFSLSEADYAAGKGV